ncbi:hypothetical protein EW026_g7154 [Hermanssonia centrifuga]|uniref:Uncharacterized protein n=1 Tax=Hermanssonia centrifuga TaxID=98765 RepID=A0A4S4K8R3_9APHY|nr:hypothetical protein EW026_g7154 [Hermanssonia centrifuga]
MSPPSSPVCRFQSDSGLQNAPELRPAEWLDDESFLLASPRSTDQDDDVEMDSEMLARDFSHASNATLGPRESVESSAEESIFGVQASIGAGCPDVEDVASIGVEVNCEAEPEELSANFIRSASLGSDVQVDPVLISSEAQSIGDSNDEDDGEASGTLSASGSAEKITIYSEIECPDRNANAMDDVEREPISEPHEELDDEPLRVTSRLTSPGRTSQTDDTEMVLKDALRFRGLLEESDSEGTLTPCGSVEPVMKEDAFDIRASLAPEYSIDNIEIKPILKSELARLAQELDGILTAQETADEARLP